MNTANWPVVTILAGDVALDTRPRKNGNGFNRFQNGYVQEAGSAYPRKFTFCLPDDQPIAYGAGAYIIGAKSFRVGQYGRLEMGFALYLEPAPASAAAPIPAANSSIASKIASGQN